jgi:hypothetical protein
MLMALCGQLGCRQPTAAATAAATGTAYRSPNWGMTCCQQRQLLQPPTAAVRLHPPLLLLLQVYLLTLPLLVMPGSFSLQAWFSWRRFVFLRY